MAQTWRRKMRALAPRWITRGLWSLGNDLVELPRRLAEVGTPRPWRVVHNIGGGDFYAVGAHFARQVIHHTRLKPDQSVLDIGCGYGRVAFALAPFLEGQGRYIGFDLSARAVDWAQRHLPATSAEMRFVHADLVSSEYNPGGREVSTSYVFPAEDGEIDVAIAISLFTHLRSADAAAYLSEIGRVLKPGGQVYLTAYLMTSHRRAHPSATIEFFPFERGAYTSDPDAPESAVAFDEEMFLEWAADAGLSLRGDWIRGHWCAGDAGSDLQDVLILQRPDRLDRVARTAPQSAT